MLPPAPVERGCSLRIIAGRFKGRFLCSFSADFIRPMTDRVKTSVFDTLYSWGRDPLDKRVLDLFSGTGNLALESLSRGAREVHIVESHPRALRIIKKNCHLLNIKSGLKIHSRDVFRFLRSYKGPAFDLVFADPPFSLKYGAKIWENFISSSVRGNKTALILELSSQEGGVEIKPPFNLFTHKTFGDKQVFFYETKDPG